jgi:hypothetical protein
MVRLRRKDPFKYLTGLERSRVALVSRKDRHRFIDRERIEERGLGIIRIATIDLLHCCFVSQDSHRMVTVLPIAIIGVDRCDIVALPGRWRVRRFCLFNGLPSALEGISVRRPNKRVRAGAYRDPPVRHRAVRVRRRQLGERVEPLRIPKTVEHREGTIELSLGVRTAGDREMHVSQFLAVSGYLPTC